MLAWWQNACKMLKFESVTSLKLLYLNLSFAVDFRLCN